MKELSNLQIDEIISLLGRGKSLPADYRDGIVRQLEKLKHSILFDAKKEYELIYADKEREEDILADTMAVPLQKVKTFRNGENPPLPPFAKGGNTLSPPLAKGGKGGFSDKNGWTNMLIFGDNLQVLKTLLQMKEKGKLKNADGTPGLRLIYIDPPFATKQEFRGSQDQKAYQDKIAGARFLEFLRKRLVFLRELLSKVDKDGRKYFDGRGGRRYLGEVLEKGKAIGDVWDDIMSFQQIPTSTEKVGYPTPKPGALLERVIKASSNPGDLVLAGSGTTCAVSEKLNRRWIGVDCGKLAIYTMQKRLLNIADSKDLENPKLVPSGSKTGKKYGKQCKPFTLYNAGLYDYKMIKELPWEQYRDFALKLFQCRDEKHEISRIELDGYLGADSVMVFNYQKYKDAMMDRGFIDDLHKHLGDKIGKRFFIIAPAASVQFLEDYIEKGKTKYFILRIPYSIIEEIHNRGFTKIKQSVSEMDVNDTVDAVGFDFIQVPTVECKYYIDKPKNQNLLNQKTKECVIKIERFESKIISRKPLEFANLETLSMVMLDYDFDGEVFDLDEVFYAEDLKKNDYEVRFAEDNVKGQMMIIYIDIFGNEKREVKTLKDFKK